MSQEFQSVGRKEPGGRLPPPPLMRDEWARMLAENQDDEFQNIPRQPVVEVGQPPSTSAIQLAPAVPTVPIVPETPLVIAARKVETSRADHEAAKAALQLAQAACEAAQQRVEATLEASQFAKKELKDLVVESLGA